jgi:hypothetical protein
MPPDLILLVAVTGIGGLLSFVVIRWDARRLNERRHRALRSFYERE